MRIAILLFLSLAIRVTGQEAAPLKYLRFVPLGDLPPHREEIKNGVRVEAPKVRGSVPPSPVSLSTKPKETASFGLKLKEFTKLLAVEPQVGGVSLFEGKNLQAEAWIKSRFPANNQFLCVLYPDHKAMNWFDPKLKIIADDLVSFPLGTVRFVNTSQYSALVRFDGDKTDLIKPGGVLLKKLKLGDNDLLVGYKLPGRKGARVEIFRNSFHLRPRQRIQAFLYKAGGKKPRRAVKFFFQPEYYPQPPKSKRARKAAGA